MHNGVRYPPPMRVEELETVVARLSPAELAAFKEWFDEFVADAWDKELESDIRAGRLDHLAQQADEHFNARRCTPL
jgi:hypothetical protein